VKLSASDKEATQSVAKPVQRANVIYTARAALPGQSADATFARDMTNRSRQLVGSRSQALSG
jgi:hypothetical protein